MKILMIYSHSAEDFAQEARRQMPNLVIRNYQWGFNPKMYDLVIVAHKNDLLTMGDLPASSKDLPVKEWNVTSFAHYGNHHLTPNQRLFEYVKESLEGGK